MNILTIKCPNCEVRFGSTISQRKENTKWYFLSRDYQFFPECYCELKETKESEIIAGLLFLAATYNILLLTGVINYKPSWLIISVLSLLMILMIRSTTINKYIIGSKKYTYKNKIYPKL